MNPAVKLRSRIGNHWQTPLRVKETEIGGDPDDDMPPNTWKAVGIYYTPNWCSASYPRHDFTPEDYNAIVAAMNAFLTSTPYPRWIDTPGSVLTSQVWRTRNLGPGVNLEPQFSPEAAISSFYYAVAAVHSVTSFVPGQASGNYFWSRPFQCAKVKHRGASRDSWHCLWDGIAKDAIIYGDGLGNLNGWTCYEYNPETCQRVRGEFCEIIASLDPYPPTIYTGAPEGGALHSKSILELPASEADCLRLSGS